MIYYPEAFQPAANLQLERGLFLRTMAMLALVGSILRLSRYLIAYSCSRDLRNSGVRGNS